MENELAIRLGFESLEEKNQLIESVDTTNSTCAVAFRHWGEVDGTKKGLLQVIAGNYLHYRY